MNCVREEGLGNHRETDKFLFLFSHVLLIGTDFYLRIILSTGISLVLRSSSTTPALIMSVIWSYWLSFTFVLGITSRFCFVDHDAPFGPLCSQASIRVSAFLGWIVVWRHVVPSGTAFNIGKRFYHIGLCLSVVLREGVRYMHR